MGAGGGRIGQEEPEEFVGGGGLLLKPFVYKNGKFWSVRVMHSQTSFETWESAARSAVERAWGSAVGLEGGGAHD